MSPPTLRPSFTAFPHNDAPAITDWLLSHHNMNFTPFTHLSPSSNSSQFDDLCCLMTAVLALKKRAVTAAFAHACKRCIGDNVDTEKFKIDENVRIEVGEMAIDSLLEQTDAEWKGDVEVWLRGAVKAFVGRGIWLWKKKRAAKKAALEAEREIASSVAAEEQVETEPETPRKSRNAKPLYVPDFPDLDDPTSEAEEQPKRLRDAGSAPAASASRSTPLIPHRRMGRNIAVEVPVFSNSLGFNTLSVTAEKDSAAKHIPKKRKAAEASLDDDLAVISGPAKQKEAQHRFIDRLICVSCEIYTALAVVVVLPVGAIIPIELRTFKTHDEIRPRDVCFDMLGTLVAESLVAADLYDNVDDSEMNVVLADGSNAIVDGTDLSVSLAVQHADLLRKKDTGPFLFKICSEA